MSYKWKYVKWPPLAYDIFGNVSHRPNCEAVSPTGYHLPHNNQYNPTTPAAAARAELLTRRSSLKSRSPGQTRRWGRGINLHPVGLPSNLSGIETVLRQTDGNWERCGDGRSSCSSRLHYEREADWYRRMVRLDDNGSYENSVWELWGHKCVCGVNVCGSVFFTMWYFWQLWDYENISSAVFTLAFLLPINPAAQPF